MSVKCGNVSYSAGPTIEVQPMLLMSEQINDSVGGV